MLLLRCRYAPVGGARLAVPHAPALADAFHPHTPRADRSRGDPDSAAPPSPSSSRSACLDNWQAASAFLSAFDAGAVAARDGHAMAEALALLAAHDVDAVAVVAEYGRSIDGWFPPIVSLARLPARLAHEASARLAVLLLAMHLVTRVPSPDGSMHTPFYFRTKSMFAALVAAGDSSLEVVQASVLLTLYEAGHGMADAAQVSMAISARIGHRLFSRKRRLEGDGIGDTEEGRVWWSINILDRYPRVACSAWPHLPETSG
jgi:hypothetical protein